MLLVRRLLAEDRRSQCVVRSSQMLDLLRESSNALELAGGGRKTKLLFRHGIRRWNQWLFCLEDPHIKFFADTSTVWLPSGTSVGVLLRYRSVGLGHKNNSARLIGLYQRDAVTPQPKDEYE